MQETHNIKHSNGFDDGIDLVELFHILIKSKWIIVSVTVFVSIVGVIYSLLLPNIYESKALLQPVTTSSGIPRALQGFGSLASLTGVNISNNDEDNTEKAIEKMSSLSFFENNILTNISLPDLMALESWNHNTNTLVYDENIYDISSNTWVRNYSYPKKQVPSAQESFEVFKAKHLNISKDTKSGFTTLSIKHQSPYVAQQWAELVIDEVNAYYRQKDKIESERAIRYLNQQILMTGLSEIKQVIAKLLQEETKKLSLIEANQAYIFDYIDPPALMEQKSEPKRALISILSFILSGMLSSVLVLSRHFLFKREPS
jgi:LPS O-antigen subunit length determinant protein (WzzB/FepE family)